MRFAYALRRYLEKFRGYDHGAAPFRRIQPDLPAGMPLQGNLDPLALVAGGESLQTAVRRILDALGDRPHIFNLGHGILQDTPVAHVEELIASVKGSV